MLGLPWVFLGIVEKKMETAMLRILLTNSGCKDAHRQASGSLMQAVFGADADSSCISSSMYLM